MSMLYTAVKKQQTVSFKIRIKILMFQGVTIQHNHFIFPSENRGKLIHNTTLNSGESMFRFLPDHCNLFFG